MFYTVHRSITINEKPTKCTNDIYFLNLLQLHVSVTFDHDEGVLLQNTVIQKYVHSSNICLFINISSVIRSSCCMLTIKIKIKKYIVVVK
jgi:hypothetical protein